MSDGLVAIVAKVINDEGGAPGNSLHSWRCEYPDRYGACGCVDQTAQMILDAILAAYNVTVKGAAEKARAAERAAIDAAWGEIQ